MIKKRAIYMIAVAAAIVFATCSKERDDKPNITMTTAIGTERSISIYLVGSGTVTIDWGDGTTEPYTLTDTQTRCNHEYSSANAHTIKISGNDISNLICSNIALTSLDVSKITTLMHLDCGHNQLMSLDVSKNRALISLICWSNKLKALNVSNNAELTHLYCQNNQLTELDVSKNNKLTHLNCQNNLLTATKLENLLRALNPVSGYIFIGGNPGTDTCDKSIADKNWTVVSDVVE